MKKSLAGIILACLWACMPSKDGNLSRTENQAEDTCSKTTFADLNLDCQLVILNKLSSKEILYFAKTVSKDGNKEAWKAFLDRAKKIVPASVQDSIAEEIEAFRRCMGISTIGARNSEQFTYRLVLDYIQYLKLMSNQKTKHQHKTFDSSPTVRPIVVGALHMAMVNRGGGLRVVNSSTLEIEAELPAPAHKIRELIPLGSRAFLSKNEFGTVQIWKYGEKSLVEQLPAIPDADLVAPVKGQDIFFTTNNGQLTRFALKDDALITSKWEIGRNINSFVASNDHQLLSMHLQEQTTKLKTWKIVDDKIVNVTTNSLQGKYKSILQINDHIFAITLERETKFGYVFYDINLGKSVGGFDVDVPLDGIGELLYLEDHTVVVHDLGPYRYRQATLNKVFAGSDWSNIKLQGEIEYYYPILSGDFVIFVAGSYFMPMDFFDHLLREPKKANPPSYTTNYGLGSAIVDSEGNFAMIRIGSHHNDIQDLTIINPWKTVRALRVTK